MYDKSPLATGLTLRNRYQVVKQLGRGGFGRTYLVRDGQLGGEYCVIKEFAPQVEGDRELAKARELFNREAGVLYQLQHPQIPKFRELLTIPVQDREGLFLVQDYVEGETYLEILNKYQKERRVFSELEVFDLLVKILPVLDYIHAQKVIHRDISPDNIIQRASDKLPVLIDFGGVKQAAVEAVSLFSKRSLTRIGKPDYAPEEQLRKGQAEPSSDLYALGVTAIVLLTGKEPHELYDARQATWVWRSQTDVSRSLAAILERMVAYLPRDRYQSALEVLQALQQHQPLVSQIGTVNLTNPQKSQSNPISNWLSSIGKSPSQTATIPNSDTVVLQKPASHPWRWKVFPLAIIGILATSAGWIWQNKGFDLLNGGQSEAKTKQTEKAIVSNLAKRRKALNISQKDFTQQVDSRFYARHPDLKRRPLTDKPEDAKFRQEWYAIGDRLLTQLEKQHL